MQKRIRFVQGNEACVEGALYAGVSFFAGYPITPSTEIAELLESSFRLTAPKRTIARLDQARNQDASTPH